MADTSIHAHVRLDTKEQCDAVKEIALRNRRSISNQITKWVIEKLEGERDNALGENG